jgi:hypothetical protein
MQVNAMAAWVLECLHCNNRFEYEKIAERGIVNYFLPQKPEVPAEGLEVTCPQCQKRARYYFADLRYGN